MAIWNNNTCNSHREFYKQYGTTPLNAQGVNHLNPFEAYFLQNGASFANSLFQIIGQSVDQGGSSSTSASGDAEVIQEHIDKILIKYNADSADDLEALVEINEDYRTDIVENETKIKTFNDINTNLAGSNTSLNSLNQSLNGEISTLEVQCEAAPSVSDRYQGFLNPNPSMLANPSQQETKEDIQKLIDAKKAIIEKNNKEIEEKKKEIEKNNEEIKKLNDENKLKQVEINKLNNLENDIQDLKTYMKQLKQAEGKDAIEGMVNKDTGNIVDLIDKYNKNPDDTKLEKKLKDALQEYVNDDSITNKSKTITTYAEKKFNITASS